MLAAVAAPAAAVVHAGETEADGEHADDAAGAVGIEIGELRLLHETVAGGEHQVRRCLVVLDLHDLRDLLLGLEREEVRDVLAAGEAGDRADIVTFATAPAHERQQAYSVFSSFGAALSQYGGQWAQQEALKAAGIAGGAPHDEPTASLPASASASSALGRTSSE